MNIINYEIAGEHISENGRMKLQEAVAQILRVLDHNTRTFDYVLPESWRCIVKIVNAASSIPVMRSNPRYTELLHLDVHSRADGRWNYAEAQMNLMEKVEYFAFATSPLKNAKMLRGVLADAEAIAKGDISDNIPLDNISNINDATWGWLRDQGIAPWYGGITVPYECFVSMPAGDDCDHCKNRYRMKKELGMIRIAFDGASPEQNLFFALSVLKVMIQEADHNFPTARARFSLDELNKIPTIKMWLQLLGIKEA